MSDSPPRALLDLAREHTTGDVTARRHQATRARVLDAASTPVSHKLKYLVIGGALLAPVSVAALAMGPLKAHRGSPAPIPSIDIVVPAGQMLDSHSENDARVDALLAEGRKAYDRKAWAESASLYRAALAAMGPDSSERSTALYNVACDEALQGHRDAAVAALHEAIAAGWTDGDHMKHDEDLASLRGETLDALIAEAASHVQAEGTNEEEGIRISVTPESAKVYWDNKLLEGMPAIAPKTGADNKSHTIRVEAPGYQTKSQLVKLSGPNVSMSLALEALPATIGTINTTGNVDDVDSVVGGLRDSLTTCYTTALEGNPKLAGATAVIHVVINKEGGVEDSDFLDRDGLPSKARTCMLSAVNDVTFTSHGKPADINFAITFRNK
jgi:hypothetical protein